MEEDSWLNDVMDLGFSSTRTSLCDVLRSLIINNIEHFQYDKSSFGTKVNDIFTGFLQSLNEFEGRAKEMARICHLYDLDANTPGNGYRSILLVGDSCILQSIGICRTICVKRDAFLFRKQNYYEELKACVEIMGVILELLENALNLHSNMEEGDVFSSTNDFIDNLFVRAVDLDTSCFYGRCLGFQV